MALPVLNPYASDCAACSGLCCVAPAFEVSEDFGLDKAAETPCPHLSADDSCRIHAELPERGFRGCVAYECWGAGPWVTRELGSWRSDPSKAALETFMRVRPLFELSMLLELARGRYASPELDAARARIAARLGSAAAMSAPGRAEDERFAREALRALARGSKEEG